MTTAHTQIAFSILLVEDDSIVCQSISRILAKEFPASSVYIAENGQAGLELFRKLNPEIVISDINMPLMDGIEMAGEIKLIKNETKFIFVTGYCDREHIEKAGVVGFVDYIVKPLDFNRLFAAIEKSMAEIAGRPC